MAKKILLIEDDQFLGDILQKKLASSGYDVSWEADGAAGFAALKSSQPDLLLLDILLPSMNGYEILEEIKKDPSLAKIPVIIISNSGQPVEITRALELGVKDYLVKAQFDPDEVLAKVRQHIEGAPPAPQGRTASFTVLVVEDDKFLSGLMVKKLQQEEWKVLLAGDGEKALQMVIGEKPDIVLLDIVLPGIDGFEVLNRLKNNPATKNIPVILLSNLGQESDIKRGHDLGAVEFMTKANFTLNEIVQKVYQVASAAKAA